MGESKRKRDRMTPAEQAAQVLTRRLMDEGKLIEAGWVLFRAQVMHPDAPDVQVREMRLAYVAGAQHLWGSIMSGLEEGQDATPNDHARMEKLGKELATITEELKLRTGSAQGSA